jgi:hypothetical protein
MRNAKISPHTSLQIRVMRDGAASCARDYAENLKTDSAMKGRCCSRQLLITMKVVCDSGKASHDEVRVIRGGGEASDTEQM